MADLRASGLGGVPKGITADRPSSPSVGDVFYNGDLGYMEMYTAQGWFAATPINPGIPTSVVATNSGSGRARLSSLPLMVRGRAVKYTKADGIMYSGSLEDK